MSSNLSEAKPVIIKITKVAVSKTTTYHFTLDIQYWDKQTEKVNVPSYKYSALLMSIYNKLNKLNQGINLGLITDDLELAKLLRIYTKQDKVSSTEYKKAINQLAPEPEDQFMILQYIRLACNSVTVY
jgi:hypothetical protein